MTIAEKIECSTINTKITLYKEGVFFKCFNEDAMVFVKRVKGYKVSEKFVKSVSIGLVMKKKIATGIVILFYTTFLNAQSIAGNLYQLSNQEIKLEGFIGLKTYPISNTTIDKKGYFNLSYSNTDVGVAYLISADNQPLFVILNGEDIEINGELLSQKETLTITKGQENQWFEQYANVHPKREQALSAWLYLQKLYKNDTLFALQNTPKTAIQTEIQRIKQEDAAFINALPKDSYVRWYLPMRKLVSSVSVIAQQRPEELPQTIQSFRQINYADSRLYKSGLFKDAIESHFWLLENSGKSIEAVFEEMKTSIDALLLTLTQDEKIFNETTNYLFDLLERHSLFEASEYLAIKVLNETTCTVNSDLAKQLETYRAMKKGNIAQDIAFDGLSYQNGQKQSAFNKLSDIKSPYTLVVFGASWCPKCNEEVPKIAQHYSKWLTQGLEVVYISLETVQKTFAENTKNYPFISYCDFKKWDSQVVQDYYVFATPTMFLLDTNQKILLRPNSVAQMDAWVDWFLVQGNEMKE